MAALCAVANCLQGPAVQSGQSSAEDISVLLTSCRGTATSIASGSASSCTVHAGFLPLPAGVAEVSARFSACMVRHKKLVQRAYLVQVCSLA